MEQIILGGGYPDALSSGVTEFNGLIGGFLWRATEWEHTQLFSPAGNLTYLGVELSDAPGSSKSYTFTVRVNGADSGLAVTIADAATTGSDTTSVAISPGDRVSLSCTPANTPDTTPTATWAVKFEGTTAKESALLACGHSANATRYIPVQSGSALSSYVITSSDDARQLFAASGKVKNLYAEASSDPGSGGDGYRYTFYLNDNPTALTCDIVEPATKSNDLVHEITVAAGDVGYWKQEAIVSPGGRNVAIGATFVADTDGESLIMGGLLDDLSNSATEFASLQTSLQNFAWGTESDRRNDGAACTLKDLYVLLSGAPNQGGDVADAYTLTVRDTDGDTTLTVTIANAATTGNDTAHDVAIQDGENLALESTPADTPTVVDAYWGLVCFIGAAPPAGHPTMKRWGGVPYMEPKGRGVW